MVAHILRIEERHLQTSGWVASLADFTCTEDDEIDPRVVIDNPNLSLYCLDDETKRAIFVQLPQDTDLPKVPFVYLTQGEQAECLIAVSYDAFLQLAAELPKVENLIPIFSTGRSGSTLLSQVFNKLDTVMSLSEPDTATQFTFLREPNRSRDAELSKLMDSTMRFLFKLNPYSQASTYVLKPRSQAVPVMDLYQTTFPQARNLFSYRDAVGWVTSWYRVFKDEGTSDSQPLSEWLGFFKRIYRRKSDDVKAYVGEGNEDIPLVKFLTLQWLISMEDCLEQHERGVQALAVRYDDLNRHREDVVSHIFAYCGLPPANVGEALRAFDRDAQAGTVLARADPKQGNTLRLTDLQVADVYEVLQRHPVINTPDYKLPGTLTV